MEHLSITFPEDLRHALDHEARLEKTKRSTLIQKAVRVYLKLKRQGQMDALLKEGYEEMTDVARKLEREFKQADGESIKYAD
jgi:metal-responsive CopG/Arc/MetJ family transcriptional regulator